VQCHFAEAVNCFVTSLDSWVGHAALPRRSAVRLGLTGEGSEIQRGYASDLRFEA